MSTLPSARAVLAGVLAAAALTAAACSGGDDGTATTTAPPRSTTTEVDAGSPPAGAVVEGLQRLEVGECFLPVEDPEAEDRAVWVVGCEDPHRFELYARVRYTGPGAQSGGFPGEVTVQDWAEESCFEKFEEFVGVPWTRSELEIQTWWPSVASWGRPDRTVLCAVTPDDGSFTTGSAAGSKA